MTTAVHAHPGWDRRRLVYGDWSWLVRDGLDVLRIAFFAGTIAFAVQGRSTAVALTAASAVLLVARVIDLPRWFDFGLTVAMTLIAYGTALSLYGGWFYYDKIVHGLSPIGYVPVLYIVLVRLGVVPDPGDAIREHKVARISGIFIITLALGVAVGGFYESIEWFEDKFLGGHFVGGLWDTETDLLCDEGGSLVGAAFLTVWALRGWTSRRVTIVPAPGPGATPVSAAAERLRPGHAIWQRRIGGLPLVAQGAVAIAAGVSIIALAAPTVRTVGIIVGVALVVSAVAELLEFARHPDPSKRADRLIVAAALAGAGAVVLVWPTISQLALLYAVGATAVVFGLAEVAALSTRSTTVRERWLGAASGIVAFVFGIAMLARPESSLEAVINLLGIYLVVIGALRLLQAADAWHRQRTRSRRDSSVDSETLPPLSAPDQASRGV
jgi:uncharacterized membrane protein HdeD (DUF308 family)/uncharacterized membrane protein YjdF